MFSIYSVFVIWRDLYAQLRNYLIHRKLGDEEGEETKNHGWKSQLEQETESERDVEYRVRHNDSSHSNIPLLNISNAFQTLC